MLIIAICSLLFNFEVVVPGVIVGSCDLRYPTLSSMRWLHIIAIERWLCNIADPLELDMQTVGSKNIDLTVKPLHGA